MFDKTSVIALTKRISPTTSSTFKLKKQELYRSKISKSRAMKKKIELELLD